MMSRERPLQSRLFIPQDLGARIPPDHLLRRIHEILDLRFTYDIVASTYGAVGHESVPPPTILKLMLLLTVYKVRSERELFRELPMRIDWLWFLGYDLSSEIPDRSVLCKARRRWGTALFTELFVRTIWLCMEHGLVEGRDLLMDSSLIDANASIDSMFVAQMIADAVATRLEALDEGEETTAAEQAPKQPKYRSKTDPDATGAKRRGETRARSRYQTHRAVDAANGVITATVVGAGHENEADRLEDLIIEHTNHTGRRVATVTADSKYGTADNLEFLEWNSITGYIPPFRDNYNRPKPNRFTECCFRYDPAEDCYVCPAGQTLRRVQYRADKDAYRYAPPEGVCQQCLARALCTKSSSGRTVSRQVRQPILDRSTARMKTPTGKAFRKLRRWMMEGSFAHSTRLGYKRARGRGLRNMTIQDLLVAAAQNLLILLWSQNRKARIPRQHVKETLQGIGKRAFARIWRSLARIAFGARPCEPQGA